MMSPASISVTLNPTSVIVAQSTTVTWTSNGTSCTASGAWSGSEAASGTMTVTPTAAGTETFTLMCSGGIYSSSTESATLTVVAASAYSATDLVADTAGGTALQVDANLVNPWGLSIAPDNHPAWTANNHTETSTLYDGNGKVQPQPAANQLIVSFAPGAAGVTFDPTGIVFNGSTSDFAVTSGGKSGAAVFVYSGEGGMIAGTLNLGHLSVPAHSRKT